VDLGVVTRFVPSATIGHIGAASTTAQHAVMQREMLRSLARFMRRHEGDRRLIRLRAAGIVAATAWLAHGFLPGRGGSRLAASIALWRSVAGDALAGWSGV